MSINKGILYIVATPIGNLQDITLRAITVLRSVDVIACEDTRRTGMLLKMLPENQQIVKNPRLISYYEHNELQRIPEILSFLKNGGSVALVSDAGTPTISDPGYKLVRTCIEEGVTVESIPGPSSVISSLVVSGLPTDKFLFLGYLPRKSGKRVSLLTELKDNLLVARNMHPTIIFFEAPHRIVQTLQEVKDVYGNISIVIVRELTKIHEEIRREELSDAITHFQNNNPKGEFVVLFNLYTNE